MAKKLIPYSKYKKLPNMSTNSKEYVNALLDQRLRDDRIDVNRVKERILEAMRGNLWEELAAEGDEGFIEDLHNGIAAIRARELGRTDIGAVGEQLGIGGLSDAELIDNIGNIYAGMKEAGRFTQAPASAASPPPSSPDTAEPGGDEPDSEEEPPEDPLAAEKGTWQEMQGALSMSGADLFNEYASDTLSFRPDDDVNAADVMEAEYENSPRQQAMVKRWRQRNSARDDDASFGKFVGRKKRQAIRDEKAARPAIPQDTGFFYRNVYQDKKGKMHPTGPVKFYDPSAARETGIRMGGKKEKRMRGYYGTKKNQAAMADRYFREGTGGIRGQHYFNADPIHGAVMKGSVQRGLNRWRENMGDQLSPELQSRFDALRGDKPVTPSSFYGARGRGIPAQPVQQQPPVQAPPAQQSTMGPRRTTGVGPADLQNGQQPPAQAPPEQQPPVPQQKPEPPSPTQTPAPQQVAGLSQAQKRERARQRLIKSQKAKRLNPKPWEPRGMQLDGKAIKPPDRNPERVRTAIRTPILENALFGQQFKGQNVPRKKLK